VVRDAADVPFYTFDFDHTQREGITIVGDADEVAARIDNEMREVGAGVLMGLFQFGSLPHDLAVKNVERFATRVLPKLR
jgi:alkanesulfonate monooxygenase SsuD/methylene tetrahydromethanopterin reductase-like flavin-dependent oxidoreductase (luciferase family)